MNSYWFEGICIGLLFGFPVGAVGALTVQRTLAYGLRMGILTGLGSSVADCFYAAVGAFGLTLISDFLMQRQGVINVAGGMLVVFLGACMLRRGPKEMNVQPGPTGILRCFTSSFLIGMTNPAAILTFLFAFTWFGIEGPLPMAQGILLVLGVFAGTFFWWLLLSGGAAVLKSKLGSSAQARINRAFGAILVMFGFIVLGKTLFFE